MTHVVGLERRKVEKFRDGDRVRDVRWRRWTCSCGAAGEWTCAPGARGAVLSESREHYAEAMRTTKTGRQECLT